MTLPGESPRPALSLREAADACSLSVKQMRRHATAGRFPDATKDARGQWRIPVTDLLAAGFHPHAAVEMPAPVAIPDELAELRAEVADLRRRAEVAEAVARERADALADARLALRALTEGKGPVPAQSVGVAPIGPAEHRSAGAGPVPAPQPAPQPGGLFGVVRRLFG